MGRSVKKDVYTFSAGAWNLTSTKLFVYNGWNLIQELDGSGTTEKSYVWGLDLSGTLQDAGGIGGLLSSIEHPASSIQLYCFDANGNVGQMINASDGSVQAHYEYDPFGNTVYDYGALKDNNLFRFSTKYFHDEMDLYYYGYRYYSPDLGRWLNKDPAEERGGLNLYAFAQNNLINLIDVLGLWDLAGVLKILCGDCKGREAVKTMSEYIVYAVEPQTGMTQYYKDKDRTIKDGEPVKWKSGGYHKRRSREIGIDETISNEEAAAVVIHETTHVDQYKRAKDKRPKTRCEREKEAHITTEQWILDRGYPATKPQYRNDNNELNLQAICDEVERLYGCNNKKDLIGEDYDVHPKNPKKTVIYRWVCPKEK